jgi:hypothetical protein
MFGKDQQHLLRMASLFATGLVIFLSARYALVPPGFGVYGHYRAGALEDNRRPTPEYAGRAACERCHDEVVAARTGSRHARIACEACHGPGRRHAEAPDVVKPARPDVRTTCLRCHSASASRPKAFPQVVASDHSPEGPCTACHVAHAPKIS